MCTAHPLCQVLVLTLMATLAAKATVEGFHTLPKYCPRRGKRTLACFVAGFAVFPMPEIFPSAHPLLRGSCPGYQPARACAPLFRALVANCIMSAGVMACCPAPRFALLLWE